MASNKDQHQELVGPLLGSVAAGGAAAGAAVLGPAAGVVAVLLAMFPGAVQLAFAHSAIAQRNRARRLWDEYVRAFGPDCTPEEAAGYIEAHASDPHVYESVTAAVRTMLDAVSDDVVPALGALAATYSREGCRPDGFFRGFARLAADLSSTEYAQLRAIVRAALEARPTGPAVVNIEFIAPKPDTAPCVCLGRMVPGLGEERTPIADAPDALRLFQLVKVNALGRDNPSGFVDSGLTGPQVVVVEHTVLKRMVEFLV